MCIRDRSDNVAGGGFAHLHAGEALELIEADSLGLFSGHVCIVVVTHCDLLVLFQSAALNAADGNAAHEFIVVNGGHQHLEGQMCIRDSTRAVCQSLQWITSGMKSRCVSSETTAREK